MSLGLRPETSICSLRCRATQQVVSVQDTVRELCFTLDHRGGVMKEPGGSPGSFLCLVLVATSLVSTVPFKVA